MKVAFITFEYPPFLHGGAGNYIHNLTRELAKLGHEIHVITPRMGASARESIEEGVFLHRIDFVNRPFLAVPSFWFYLRKKFPSLERQAGGFDIVHDNGLSGFSLSRKAVSSPRVITVHHLTRTALKTMGGGLLKRVTNLRDETGISPIIEPWCIRRADRIVAVSQFTRQDIINVYAVPDSKIEVIYHGVHLEDFVFPGEAKSKLRDNLNISQPMVLYVGNLFPRKGVDTLLRALPAVLREIDVKLVVAGDGNMPVYQQLAQTLGISDKLHFLGRVTDDTLRLLYASCDLFVLPSRLEGLGIAILEAMAAGKPVVATNVGGIPELIESGQNGILVAVSNEGELASAMVKLLNDRALAWTMGQNNIQKVRQLYSWDIAARKTEHLYRELLKK